MKEWLLKPAVYRTTLVIYVLCLIASFGAYVGVALWDVSHSVYVQGPTTMVRNQATTIRAIVLHAQTGRHVRRAKKVTLGLLPEGTRAIEGVYPPLMDELTLNRKRTLHTSHAPLKYTYTPTAPAGTYQLVLRGVFDDDDDVFEARTTIKIVDVAKETEPWPEHTSRRNTHERDPLYHGVVTPKGPVRIAVIPSKPNLIRGLTSPVYLATFDATSGAAVPCTITWDEQAGLLERPLPKRVRTDALGLARLDITPMLSQRWKLKATCKGHDVDSTAAVYLETIASQISLNLMSSTVAPGSKLKGYVTSLHRRGLVHTDVRMASRWLNSGAFGLGPGKSGLLISIPEDTPDLTIARVQVFMDMYMQDRVWDMRYVVVQKTHSDMKRALLHVLQLLQTHDTSTLQPFWSALSTHPAIQQNTATPRQLKQWLHAMLFALPRHFDPPQVLINSLSKDQARLEARKVQLRKNLIVIIGLALSVGILALLMTVIRAMQSHRARQRLVDELAFDPEEQDDLNASTSQDESDEQDAMATRQRRDALMMMTQSVMLVGTIIVFAAMLIMVLNFL